MWRDLSGRADGPLSFRFILQPVMAAVAAFHDGYWDARAGRSPFLWTLLMRPADRVGRMREALIATARIILLGFGMDALYQAWVLKTFYPGEMLAIAFLLALLPYVLLRGAAMHIATWWLAHGPSFASEWRQLQRSVTAHVRSFLKLVPHQTSASATAFKAATSSMSGDNMLKKLIDKLPERPVRVAETPLPPMPAVDTAHSDVASVQYSHHRTELSGHRTGLSEHRTALSEFRTDLSSHRTDLSESRTELSMRRTGMSFQRTRMSADRTLMSVIRTSLSLIGFGFTIFQFFEKMRDAGVLKHAEAPRNFGIALVLLGIAMLVMGIVYHVQFMIGLRHARTSMQEAGLVHAESIFPPSLTLITAVVLLLIGIAAIISMLFQAGPFG
jgi:uncharacterized membrane protein YidH (DUF202 family)